VRVLADGNGHIPRWLIRHVWHLPAFIFDATPHAEFRHSRVEQTVTPVLPDEVPSLEAFEHLPRA
jgi:hypothetical protein